MASSGSRRKKKRKHAGYRGDLRFVKTRPDKKKRTSRSASGRKTAAKKKTATKARPAKKTATAARKPKHVSAGASGDGADVRGVTPGWNDLLTDNSARTASLKTPEGRLAAMSTAKVALVILAVAGLFTLYVGHIYATQDLLADVQRLRTENIELDLQRNQLSSAWDRTTAPAVISDRAGQMGFRESVPLGEPIIVED
ncbi:MAG: hypothetical protein HKN17_06760 [Rhodothermales bacterium]|nr:hypothetical protein [Rhodothermales bacterium]